MEGLPLGERLVWIVQTVATVWLLLSLIRGRVAWRYRWLAGYLVFSLGRTGALMGIPYNTNAYAYSWALTLVLNWVLAALVVREVAGKVLDGYHGLSVLSRRTLVALVLLCAVGALAVVSFGFDYSREPFPLLRTVLLFEQWMAAMLFFVLLLAAAFLLWFPVPLPRNVHLYSSCFSLSLLVSAVAVGLLTVAGPDLTRLSNLATMLVHTLCFGFWAWRFQRAQEDGPRLAAIPRGAEAEQRLLSQLAALNRALEYRAGGGEIKRQ